jgi:hypothetical protein
MALWSCFEGVPGWYQKAFEEGVFTADSYNAEKLKDFTRRRLRLQPEEETYISGISRQHGRAYNLSIDRNNPILDKLLNNGIIGYGKSQHLYVIDPVVFAAIECRDDARTPTQIIQCLKGFGFESIVHHMTKDILLLQNIKQPLFPSTRGNGEMDIDNFFINDDNSYCACFSDKLDNQSHKVKFCSNIENKLHSSKPSEIGIFLCSPTNVNTGPVAAFTQFNFSWTPKVTVYKLEVASLVTQKAQDLNNEFFAINVVMQMVI